MLEIQTTNEQKGFHLAEWLLRPVADLGGGMGGMHPPPPA